VTITLLYGCCQVETCARDLAAVREFMVDVLGAGPIEQALARQIAALIPGVGYDIDHLDCGQAVFQINQPAPSMTYNGQKSVHESYLERIGPCVTNLNFFVDDYMHAHELLTSMGAETYIKGPSSVARALADYGPDNSRAGADDRPFLFLGARHLIGLDLEIMEPNFLRFTRQAVQFPAFVQPRPPSGDGNLRLKRLIIAVSDLQATYEALVKLFAPASRSNAYCIQEGTEGKAFRIGLGGIEIEYCRPHATRGKLADHLARFGPGVVAISFGARDAEAVLERCRAHGSIGTASGFDLLGQVSSPARHRIESRSLIGFDVIFEEINESVL
jgi:hypothetical protein